ncbi:hypothetical protein ACFYWS_11765 [Streptomyces sp. NPDC002795]|uniref:hypothetical protein n=1 Tax=Streptomyces sp. NPDC002795 TaxID=3364665 RepID=UPI003699D5E0
MMPVPWEAVPRCRENIHYGLERRGSLTLFAEVECSTKLDEGLACRNAANHVPPFSDTDYWTVEP